MVYIVRGGKLKQNIDIIQTVVRHEASNLDVLHNEQVTYKLIRDESVKYCTPDTRYDRKVLCTQISKRLTDWLIPR